MKTMRFRAIIPERNAGIYFDLNDLAILGDLDHIARLGQKFSTREILVPWLLGGNVPDLYTGRKDKNGNTIYGRDIIRYADIEIEGKKFSGITHIWFRAGSFVLDKIGSYQPFARDGKAGLGFYTPSIYSINTEKQLEVIGNVTQNPELLGEK